MQLPLRIWDHSSPLGEDMAAEGWASRPLRQPTGPSPAQRIGLAATVGLHLLVATALLIRWDVTKTLPIDPLVFVQIAANEPDKPVEAPPEPKLKPTKLDLNRVELPQVEEATNAITQPREPAAPPRVAPARDVLETYAGRLFRHLYRYKRPAKEQGTAFVSFTIDTAGRVLAHRITKSSGVPALDREALALIERASPVPAPPDDMIRGRSNVEVALPIEFTLR